MKPSDADSPRADARPDSDRPCPTPAEMELRVARFADLKSSARAFVDTLIPGCERDIFSIIGQSTYEDPDLKPRIEAQQFHMGVIRCEPGKGAAHHSHQTEEVFMALDGTWSVFWGEDETTNHIVLRKWDVVSVPVDVMRGFRNIGGQVAHLLAIVGGHDPGRISWPRHVGERIEAAGYRLDEHGVVVGTP